MATNENGKNAEQVCRERLADIAALLDQIGQEMYARFSPVEEAGVDWATAGDLSRIREGLVETLEVICPLSRKEIEDTLAELRG